jgi:hypothetical protein
VKTVLFYRRFPRFSGGALKVWDYFNHVRSSPHHTALVRFSDDSVWDESNPWAAAKDLVVDDGTRIDADILFLAGIDWLQLDPSEREHSPVPIINYIAHVWHAYPDDHLGRYAFLSHKAIRICMSPEVEAAIRATGRVNGPVFTIPGALDLDALPAGREASERDTDLLIVANKSPKLGRRLSKSLERADRRVHLIDNLILRREFLDLVGRSRVTLFLPNRKEGFYLPALEGMALRTIVVCPDCVGNRSFCLDGLNCFRPAFSAEEMVEAAEAALEDRSGLGEMLDRAASTARQYDLKMERETFLEILRDVGELWRSA